jgi:hypothetical protein
MISLIEMFGGLVDVLASLGDLFEARPNRRRGRGLIADIPQLPVPPVRSQLSR